MGNARSVKNTIISTAAYITAAVLLIVLTFVARKIDYAYFSSYKPFKPAEMITEAVFIIAASVLIIKHRGKGLLKSVGKHLIFALIPLALFFAAFFYLPDKINPADRNLVYTLDSFLSAFADDFILCAAGCTLLLHKADLKAAGVIIMLAGMAAYELALSEEKDAVLALSVIAVIVIGYFEIQLHMSSGSALFCGIFHFLLHLTMHLPHLNSARSEPYFGSTAAKVLYAISLVSMLVLGIILNKKRRSKIKASV
ncbi:MAG: hypothetical protein IJT49_00420 [Clostridia bacterium]|nr:hypothetical protein [Clostridia bacterium]